MARYDISLADERGAVRADQHRTYRSAFRYGRDYHLRRESTWNPPGQMRGYRGGNAGSYGVGQDYDRVYRGGPDAGRFRSPRGRRRFPQWEGGRRDTYWADRYGFGYDRGYNAGPGGEW